MAAERHRIMRKLVDMVIILAAVIGAGGCGAGQITVDEKRVTIREGQKATVVYRYADVVSKPFVEKLYTPAGINILRDDRDAVDHPWHHGLMMAIKVDGMTFWDEREKYKPGRQVHRRFGVGKDIKTSSQRSGFTEKIDWIDPRSKEKLLKETRTLEVANLKRTKVTLLTWRSKFEVAEGKESAVVGGDHYHGVGMRFVKSMDGGEFVFADGKTGEVLKNEGYLTQAKWCAYQSKVDGEDVTVAMFDQPKNIRPVTWFSMAEPFSYMSATIALNKKAVVLHEGDSLLLVYGIALWDGKIEAAEIEEVYRQWIGCKDR